MGVALQLYNLEFFSPKDILCQVWKKLAKCFWRRGFLNVLNVFYLFRYYLTLEKGRALQWTNLSTYHARMFVRNLVEIGCFLNFVNVFSLFSNYLPLEKSEAFHLNKIESTPSNDDMCQVWLKLTTWFWRTIFVKFVNVYLFFS